MIEEFAYAEDSGLSVEYDDRRVLIVSDDSGDTSETGPVPADADHDEIAEAIEDGIRNLAYGIAVRLASKLEGRHVDQ